MAAGRPVVPQAKTILSSALHPPSFLECPSPSVPQSKQISPSWRHALPRARSQLYSASLHGRLLTRRNFRLFAKSSPVPSVCFCFLPDSFLASFAAPGLAAFFFFGVRFFPGL